MMRPIQFEKNEQINLNRLKLQLDRRVDLITMMVKGMKSNKPEKMCSDKCCEMVSKFCQTEQLYQPLNQINNFSLSNTPSVKSLKSPNNLKRQSSIKNKQNFVNQSASSIQSKNKNKKLLKSIQESEHQALKTSRYLRKLQSQKKKFKPTSVNTSTAKKSSIISNLQRKNSKYQSDIKEGITNVLKSFDSANKIHLTEKKTIQNVTKKFQKQLKTQEKVLNFSFNSSIVDHSESKSKVRTRKDSITINDSFTGNSSTNIPKKQNTSYSTNNLSITLPVDQYQQDIITGPKRMLINEQVKLKIQDQFQSRLQALKKKTGRQHKANNIRISLLKRLEDKHFKSQEVTK